MATITRDEFLDRIWHDINEVMREKWIDNLIRNSELNPDAPFSDMGEVLKRLLALGASRRDLSMIARHAAYESAYEVLYDLVDPGLPDEQVELLHESLLAADPSGKQGRPGSAPEKSEQGF